MTSHLPMFPPARSNNPFEIARRDLVAAIAAMPVPYGFDSFPAAKQFEDVGEHIHYMAVLIDRWLSKIGREIASNSTAGIDEWQFTETMVDATDGWCIFECTKAAEQVRADAEEFV
jgi:hypothetical protein